MSVIRKIRKEVFSLTQSEFAELAGVSQGTVSRWESGVDPSLSDLRSIWMAACERGLPLNGEDFFQSQLDETPS